MTSSRIKIVIKELQKSLMVDGDHPRLYPGCRELVETTVVPIADMSLLAPAGKSLVALDSRYNPIDYVRTIF
jgi:hypothetical protein